MFVCVWVLYCVCVLVICILDGFFGLVVSILVTGNPEFAGSNPAEAVGFFGRPEILSMPSFGGEVK